MTTRPDAAGLLAIARETFLREIAPHVSGERRFEAAMVANAMAIAERDASARNEEETAELAMLRWIYGEDETRLAGPDDGARRRRLARRLAADIRAGRLDRMLEGRLRALLLERAAARLAVSNPRQLEAFGLG